MYKFLLKIGTDNYLWMPYKCYKFSQFEVCNLQLEQFLSSMQKDKQEEKIQKCACLNLEHSLHNFLKIMFLLVCGHLHHKFGNIQIKDHRAINESKLVYCFPS